MRVYVLYNVKTREYRTDRDWSTKPERANIWTKVAYMKAFLSAQTRGSKADWRIKVLELDLDNPIDEWRANDVT